MELLTVFKYAIICILFLSYIKLKVLTFKPNVLTFKHVCLSIQAFVLQLHEIENNSLLILSIYINRKFKTFVNYTKLIKKTVNCTIC